VLGQGGGGGLEVMWHTINQSNVGGWTKREWLQNKQETAHENNHTTHVKRLVGMTNLRVSASQKHGAANITKQMAGNNKREHHVADK
jgi:hypothetical protein